MDRAVRARRSRARRPHVACDCKALHHLPSSQALTRVPLPSPHRRRRRCAAPCCTTPSSAACAAPTALSRPQSGGALNKGRVCDLPLACAPVRATCSSGSRPNPEPLLICTPVALYFCAAPGPPQAALCTCTISPEKIHFAGALSQSPLKHALPRESWIPGFVDEGQAATTHPVRVEPPP